MESLGKIDTLPPYTSADIEAIRIVLNEKFLKDTPLTCEKLTIKKAKVFFKKNGSDEESYGYGIECELLQAGKKVEVMITPISRKTETEIVARHIAHQVLRKVDE